MRELFTTQIRNRLTRKGFTPRLVEDSIHRLHAEGALDDRRAAAAYAWNAVQIKSRGRRRTLRELGDLGVSPHDAQQAVDEAYAAVSEEVLLTRVLNRRLTGPIETRAQFRRLYGALLRQGFESTAVVAALKAKTVSALESGDDS